MLNWLFIFESCISGLLAGFLSWLTYHGGNPWNLIENFQTGLMTSGMFCGLFAGLASFLPIIVMQRKISKALNYLVSGFVVGFSISVLFGVVYSLIIESIINSGATIPSSVIRFFWWLILAIGLSSSFGFLHGSIKALCRGLMGFTPAFIIAGALTDKIFIIDSRYMLSFLFLGGMIGLGFSIAWELLKEAWLDEYKGWGINFRYYIDENEFSCGSADECDLTITSGPEVSFIITEKDSVHIFELQDENFGASVNKSKFRYRALVDGDKINVQDKEFIYHSTLSRTREEMPELS